MISNGAEVNFFAHNMNFIQVKRGGRALKITVEEAAKTMGVSPMFLRIGLREGEYPFGKAVKFSKNWSYHIDAVRFEKWMAGEDMAQEAGNDFPCGDLEYAAKASREYYVALQDAGFSPEEALEVVKAHRVAL